MTGTAGGEMDWDEALALIEAGLTGDTAVCRHGNHQIHKDPRGAWVDDAGLEVCVKAPLENTGHGRRPDYVMHEPVKT